MNLNDLKNNGTISVMFHYVRNNETEDTPNLNSLSVEDFNKQLDWLEEFFQPMSFKEYDYCIKENKAFPDNKFLLTFDDGLKDHYKYVYPELKKRGLWGFFYINSQVYTEKSPMAVHVTHMVIDKIGSGKYTKIIKQELKKYNVSIEDFHLNGVYRYDDISNSNIKKIMNYLLDYKIRDKIIYNIFFEFFDNKEDFCENLYCSESELKEMIKEGVMVVGGHTHSHLVLSRLDKEKQYKELKICFDYINRKFGVKSPVFCFPYGQKHTYDKFTLRALKEIGYHSSFNTVRGMTCVKKTNKYELQRYDTVDLCSIGV